MKHIIIGTAGHIDHGKTTLIKALTGRDTDRLKEEQKRGISIDLGFTYFDLPSGHRAGIIDVPGHEKFIKNMLAGVMGMDLVLLVVAADEGIMPQTVEHLSILNLLGIKRGFVVLTKVDLVEDEWLELVEEEVAEEIKGTFLEDSPIIRVSSTKKTGIEELINLIDSYVSEMEDRDISDMPRLPVDRVFTVSGFGNVITGTLISGKLNIGDKVQIYPSNFSARIRSLQVHDQDTDVAYAGQRVAVNIVGIKKEQIKRGDVLALLNQMKATRMLDVKVKLLDSIDVDIKNRTRLRLYLGTREVLCRIVLLDKEILRPGEEAYAQLRLEEEIVAKRADRFIIRFYSPMFTIGGGMVLEPNPKKRRSLDRDAIEELQIKEYGEQEDIIENIIKEKSNEFLSLKEIAAITSILEEKLIEDLNILSKKDKLILFNFTKDTYVIHLDFYNKISEMIIQEIREYHQRYPLRRGISKELIRRKFLKNAPNKVGDMFIQRLIDAGILVQELDLLRLDGYEIEYNPEQLMIKDEIIKNLKDKQYLIPKSSEIIDSLEYNRETSQELFNSLIDNGDIIRLEDEIFILKDLYEKAKEDLVEFINKNASISVAEFRDLLNTNRKIALALLESFDGQGITKREENKRILTND
ncbi:MAG TPA: selenocysteine-specific translation elongation factor [Tissierellaceae bacterium]|nr:selenocysteine-specific translation elongation factor [Tissierellaceae bacterium]